MDALTPPQVDIQNASDAAFIPSEHDFLNWVTIAISEKKPDAEVSIRIVDNLESQTLNKQYRGIDKPTNVLSFPAEFPADVYIHSLLYNVLYPAIVELDAKPPN